MSVRVLYSFPHKLGADRICNTAWEQVRSLAATGAEVVAMPGVLHRAVLKCVVVQPTLSRGRYRKPYKQLGVTNACMLHDHIVAGALKRWPVRYQHCALLAPRRPQNAGSRQAFEYPNRFGASKRPHPNIVTSWGLH